VGFKNKGGDLMARKRMIDPCIWASEDFGKLSTLAKIVWIGLISNADDFGRGRAKVSYIKSNLFPYDDDKKEITIKKIEEALNGIAERMSIIFYECDDNEYYQLTNWYRFQTIDRIQESKIPVCPDNSHIIRRLVAEQSASNREQVAPNIKEYNISEKNINQTRTREGALDEIIIAFTQHDPLREELREFVKTRSRIRKPLTEHALELLLTAKNGLLELSGKNHDVALEIVRQSVANSWQGFYPLKKTVTKNGSAFFDTLREV
jgi:hypothetical protein